MSTGEGEGQEQQHQASSSSTAQQEQEQTSAPAVAPAPATVEDDASPKFKVQLAVYDLSQGMARSLGPALLGMEVEAIYHTGKSPLEGLYISTPCVWQIRASYT